ncbi:NlpC/P60 family protein [Ornithinimicrobium sp. INDO-MA30-4]|uniref:NlpC/P60 family protein n=1 Tax=Ornithinimicrobium sp. INDO-MA30-4 TaxID=2908651 RepID=UPI0028832345|nr:NlpC/P60 family protein [Ornithinimicrobium sp. INDO-MA30-4]
MGWHQPSTGFDCSGYTQYVYAKVGVDLPRTAEAQRQATTPFQSPARGFGVLGCPGMAQRDLCRRRNDLRLRQARIPTQKRKMFSGVTSYGRVG